VHPHPCLIPRVACRRRLQHRWGHHRLPPTRRLWSNEQHVPKDTNSGYCCWAKLVWNSIFGQTSSLSSNATAPLGSPPAAISSIFGQSSTQPAFGQTSSSPSTGAVFGWRTSVPVFGSGTPSLGGFAALAVKATPDRASPFAKITSLVILSGFERLIYHLYPFPRKLRKPNTVYNRCSPSTEKARARRMEGIRAARLKFTIG
jgi:hypothetical protein